mgnify:FL=1
MIDKRLNFRGGGMDMGNASNQAQSASMGNTTSSNTSSGTGGSSGNLGGGGGGQDSDYRRYEAPTRPTYNSTNIDQKPITGADFQRSENEFINNFNQNEASRFEPTFFNRNYNPITLDQFGSRNQLPNYGNAIMGGIMGLINPLAGLAYRGYNYFKNKAPQTLNTFKQSPTLMDFYNNMRTAPVNDTIDIREKFNRTEGLSDVRPTPQIFEFDPTNFNTRNVATVNSFDEIDNQVAELTDKQKAFINNQKTAIELGAQTPQDVYDKITNPDYPIYDSGIFGFGQQEPTTVEEYNNYLQSIGINQRIV